MDSARPILQKLVADVLNGLPAEQVPVEAWQFACGKQVAERTRALSFERGVLCVEVPDAQWREQLQGLSGGYLASLNQYSRTRVERIKFVIAAAGFAAGNAAGREHPSVAKAGSRPCADAPGTPRKHPSEPTTSPLGTSGKAQRGRGTTSEAKQESRWRKPK